jgi:hypothetical protein
MQGRWPGIETGGSHAFFSTFYVIRPRSLGSPSNILAFSNQIYSKVTKQDQHPIALEKNIFRAFLLSPVFSMVRCPSLCFPSSLPMK